MPLLNLPLNLPGETITEIMKQIVDELTQEFEVVAQSVYSDGVFPGVTHNGPQTIQDYLEVTDPRDYRNIFDEDYLLRLENGLDAPPVSKFWLNQLSVRSSFDRNRKEFMRLLTNADRITPRMIRQQ